MGAVEAVRDSGFVFAGGFLGVAVCEMKWAFWAVVAVIVMVAAGKVVAGLYDLAIQKMAEAIKSFEGWYVGSRSYRNNNPGNLKFHNQAGAIGQDETGHAVFGTYESGWNALVNQLRLAFYGGSAVYSLSDTLYTFFSKYAEANSGPYARYVAGALGVSPDTALADLRG